MTQEDLTIKRDIMRFTKDKSSANLVILAIVFDCLYFVSLYSSDVGSYFYTWKIGASIIYNLLFLLTAFLASEGVKNRKTGYTGLLIGIGIMQIVRIFYIPMQARAATVVVSGEELAVMGNGQFIYVSVCLAISGICCLIAAVTSSRNNKALAEHMRSIENAA